MHDISEETVYLFLDEADKLGEIYNLPRNIETAGARKLSISLITSNLNKLKNIYGDEFYTITNSIDTELLLGTNTKSDIEYFSDILGLDDEFIKNDLEGDKLLIAEKELKPILASKSYFYENQEWNQDSEK